MVAMLLANSALLGRMRARDLGALLCKAPRWLIALIIPTTDLVIRMIPAAIYHSPHAT